MNYYFDGMCNNETFDFRNFYFTIEYYYFKERITTRIVISEALNSYTKSIYFLHDAYLLSVYSDKINLFLPSK